MPYFPEYYGGEYWNHALNQVGKNFGEAIGKSMEFYRQRHEENDQLDRQIREMRFTPGADGKTPLIDNKTYERITAGTEKERHGNEKAYLAVHELGQNWSKAQAEIGHINALREEAERPKRPFYDPVSKQWYYPTRGGIAPLKVGRGDADKWIDRYAHGLGTTRQVLATVDPKKMKLYAMGKELDPNSPVAPEYGMVTAPDGTQIRVPAKDIPRFSNTVGIAKETAAERGGKVIPRGGEIVWYLGKPYRKKSDSSNARSNYEEISKEDAAAAGSTGP